MGLLLGVIVCRSNYFILLTSIIYAYSNQNEYEFKQSGSHGDGADSYFKVFVFFRLIIIIISWAIPEFNDWNSSFVKTRLQFLRSLILFICLNNINEFRTTAVIFYFYFESV